MNLPNFEEVLYLIVMLKSHEIKDEAFSILSLEILSKPLMIEDFKQNIVLCN